jgi:hypothetical protein
LIFYTLKGPSYELEIYEDKLRLIKKPWTKIFSRKKETLDWPIKDISQFEITVPKFMMVSGKLEWHTFSGETAHFRFSTTPAMVKKIETYIQKRVIKNHEAIHKAKVIQLAEVAPKRIETKKQRRERERIERAAANAA